MGSANQSTEQRRHPWQPKHTLQLGVRGERAHRAVSMPSRHGRNVCKRRDTAAAEIQYVEPRQEVDVWNLRKRREGGAKTRGCDFPQERQERAR